MQFRNRGILTGIAELVLSVKPRDVEKVGHLSNSPSIVELLALLLFFGRTIRTNVATFLASTSVSKAGAPLDWKKYTERGEM